MANSEHDGPGGAAGGGARAAGHDQDSTALARKKEQLPTGVVGNFRFASLEKRRKLEERRPMSVLDGKFCLSEEGRTNTDRGGRHFLPTSPERRYG